MRKGKFTEIFISRKVGAEFRVARGAVGEKISGREKPEISNGESMLMIIVFSSWLCFPLITV
jgi:hypothetical protein